jgi:hypothetical protein
MTRITDALAAQIAVLDRDGNILERIAGQFAGP